MEEIIFEFDANEEFVLTSEVREYFIGHCSDSETNGKTVSKRYNKMFSGIVLDEFHSYPKIIRNIISDYNLLGIKLELIFQCNRKYSMINCITYTRFTIYTSKNNAVLIKIVSDFIIKDYLTKFNSML